MKDGGPQHFVFDGVAIPALPLDRIQSAIPTKPSVVQDEIKIVESSTTKIN